jgi:hypothetical protein
LAQFPRNKEKTMRILSIFTAIVLTASTASAQQTLADYGLDQTIPAEVQAFVAISDAMNQAQETSEIGLALFSHFAETKELDDDTLQAMQNWESLAAMTWLQFNRSIAGADALIAGRITEHCGESNLAVQSCVDAMEDRIEFYGQYVDILRGMEGFDMIQTGIDAVLN